LSRAFFCKTACLSNSLGESVIFFLDSFSFSFSDSHVETSRPFNFNRVVSDSLSSRNRGYGAPLSTGDLDQLVEKDFVVFVDCNVFLVG